MSFNPIQHFQYVCLLKMLELLEMFRKCVYFATLKRTDTTNAVPLNRLNYNNVCVFNEHVSNCQYSSGFLCSLYNSSNKKAFTFTVKSAYKEPAYKELLVVRNWFSLPNLYLGIGSLNVYKEQIIRNKVPVSSLQADITVYKAYILFRKKRERKPTNIISTTLITP